MKSEQIPSRDSFDEAQIPEQLDFDFDEAAVRVRAKELQNEHGWTEPYAISVAKIEFERKRREKRSEQGGKSH